MNKKVTIRWVSAGKNIAINPNIKIICPECQKSYLQVIDTPNEDKPSEIERHIFCQECGAYNALRLTR